MGLMRGRTIWLAGLVAAGLTLAPVVARAQDGGLTPDGGLMLDGPIFRAQTPDGAIPDEDVPLPLGHNPANKGGFFIGAEFLFFRQTNTLEHQPIGFQGFFDADGILTGNPGSFVGSGKEVLDAKMAGGPGTYTPGLRTTLGYSWKDGTSIDIQWLHLEKAQYWH